MASGLTVIVGANGTGKTNLLEAVHVGTQGFSLRTRRDSRVIRFGCDAACVRVAGAIHDRRFQTEVTVAPGAKRIVLDGAPADGADALRRRFPVLAFTPDRLAVVKGVPALRRAYLDRVLGRVFPARADLPGRYGHALAQRNAALRRIRAGFGSREALHPWSEMLASLGSELDSAREETIQALAPAFAAAAARLGLAAGELEYAGLGLSAADLEARLQADLERGSTGAGPHLRDVGITAGGRELRQYGSQGEQRTAVLALLLAEATVLVDLGGEPPLLLLDDVLSELDDSRRSALLGGVPGPCQTLVTTTTLKALPSAAAPALVIEVAGGRAIPR